MRGDRVSEVVVVRVWLALFLFAGLVNVRHAAAQANAFPPDVAKYVTADPERAHLGIEDIRRFAQVLRAIDSGAETDPARAIERDYLAQGSPGLRAYAERYEVTGASMAAALRDRLDVYRDLDRLADVILEQEPALQAAFGNLAKLVPGAIFPPIWFVVGHHGPGGLARPEGVLIAAERLVTEPHLLVPLVLHELAHIQQAVTQGLDVYRRIYGPDATLLALALREGSADLIAELTTGRHFNPAGERYGLAHEAELWERFREDMHRSDPGDWMFVQPSNAEWPPDLGYWMGYRIAKSYYEHADDKGQAIRDMLGLTDFQSFLQKSRYAETVSR